VIKKIDAKDETLAFTGGQLPYEMSSLKQEIFDALKVGLLWADKENHASIEKRLQVFLQIAEQSPVTVVITDLAGRIEYVNPKFTQTTGYSREEVLGHNPRILNSGVTKASDYKEMWRKIAAGDEWRGEFHNKRKDGSLYWESALIAPIFNADEKKTHYLAIKEDITLRKNAEEALRMNEARLAGIVNLLEQDDKSLQEFLDEALSVAIELTESRFGYIYLYNEAEKTFVLNSRSGEVIQECAGVKPQTCHELNLTGAWGEAVRQRKPVIINDFQAEHPLQKECPPGDVALQKFVTFPVFSGSKVVSVIGLANKKTDYGHADVLQMKLLMDSVWKVVERKKAQEELVESNRQLTEATRLANALTDALENYDQLTGLANRSQISARLSHLLQGDRSSILVLVNVDRFKTVNNALGLEMGDRILKAFGKRLLELKKAASFVGRLGADEFTMIYDLCEAGECDEVQGAHTAAEILDAVQEEMTKPFLIGSEELRLTASIGAAVISRAYVVSAQEALRRADMALRRAKAAGGNQCIVFDSVLDREVREHYAIEMELHRGITGGELRLFLQPQIDASGRVEGVEALVRWAHPDRGLLYPDSFIPIAEESPLIIELGQWVLAESCWIIRRLEAAGRTVSVSVNVSPSEFHSADFVDRIRRTLAVTGANPKLLVLEVTEGLMIRDVENVIVKMDELAEIGVRFSIDDFGTGYSSLAYLKRLPIAELKIDRTFIRNASWDLGDAMIVDTILSIAKNMKLRVVAEGVETGEHAEFLSARGEMTYQGYLYGRPQESETWLAQYLGF